MSIDGISIESYGGQAVGATYKAKKTRILIKAIEKPADYLRDRAKKLEDLDKEMSELWAKQYALHVGKGVPPEDAKDRANMRVRKQYEIGLEEIETDFPEDINETASKLTYKTATVDALASAPTGARHRSKK